MQCRVTHLVLVLALTLISLSTGVVQSCHVASALGLVFASSLLHEPPVRLHGARRTVTTLAFGAFLLPTSFAQHFRCSSVGNTPLKEERDVTCPALGDLYVATGGPAWTKKSKWAASALGYGRNLCEFSGVTCLDRAPFSVVGLNLSANNLRGTLPSSLSDLTTLEELDVSNNPHLVGALPTGLASLQRLRVLRLGQTGLNASGFLFFNKVLSSLGELDVSQTSTTAADGRVLDFISNLTRLRVLRIAGAGLSGTFPTSLQKLTALEELDVSDNPMLAGPVPDKLLTRLRNIRATGTGLCGLFQAAEGKNGRLAPCLEVASPSFWRVLAPPMWTLLSTALCVLHGIAVIAAAAPVAPPPPPAAFIPPRDHANVPAPSPPAAVIELAAATGSRLVSGPGGGGCMCAVLPCGVTSSGDGWRATAVIQSIGEHSFVGSLFMGIACAASAEAALRSLVDAGATASAGDGQYGILQPSWGASASAVLATCGFVVREQLPPVARGDAVTCRVRAPSEASDTCLLLIERDGTPPEELTAWRAAGDTLFLALRAPAGARVVVSHSPPPPPAAAAAATAAAAAPAEAPGAAAGGGESGARPLEEWSFGGAGASAGAPRLFGGARMRPGFASACRELRRATAASVAASLAASSSGDALSVASTHSLRVPRAPLASLLAESVRQLGHTSGRRWAAAMSVNFVSEEGIDVGGLTREWFALVSEALMASAIITPTARDGAHECYLAPGAATPAALGQCRFLGGFLAKALVKGSCAAGAHERTREARNGVIALGGLRICDVLFDVLLGNTLTLAHLRDVDPRMYSSLQKVIETDVEAGLDLVFQVEDRHEDGSTSTTNLVANGSRVAVTNANKHAYAQLRAQHILYRSMQAQLDAVCDGFYDIVPSEALKRAAFTAAELRALLCGQPSLDLADLRANTHLDARLQGTPLAAWLWEVLGEATEAQRFAFVRFATGACGAPAGGFAQLGSPALSVAGVERLMNGSVRYPTGKTCSRMLLLPMYHTKAELRDKLLDGICNTEFGLS